MNDMVDSKFGDIIEPSRIPFSFDTVGWRIVMATLVVIAITLSVIYIVRYIKRRYRREALVKFNLIQEEFRDNRSERFLRSSRLIHDLSYTLYGKEKVLSGYEWFISLKLNSKSKIDITKEEAKFASMLPYSKVVEKIDCGFNSKERAEIEAKVIDLYRDWIVDHRALKQV